MTEHLFDSPVSWLCVCVWTLSAAPSAATNGKEPAAGRKAEQEREASRDLGHRWRAWPSSYNPGSSEQRKEDPWANFLDQMLVQTGPSETWAGQPFWGGADLWKVTQHVPQHPAHPSGPLPAAPEKISQGPSGKRETRAKDSWEAAEPNTNRQKLAQAEGPSENWGQVQRLHLVIRHLGSSHMPGQSGHQ